jgi:hypothetical protein
MPLHKKQAAMKKYYNWEFQKIAYMVLMPFRLTNVHMNQPEPAIQHKLTKYSQLFMVLGWVYVCIPHPMKLNLTCHLIYI